MMSSGVFSFLSGPGDMMTTSSSVHWILNGLPQASSVLDAASIALSCCSCEMLGQSALPFVPRHCWMALRTARALVSVILICASVKRGRTATVTPAAIRLRIATTIRTSMRVTPRALLRRRWRGCVGGCVVFMPGAFATAVPAHGTG